MVRSQAAVASHPHRPRPSLEPRPALGATLLSLACCWPGGCGSGEVDGAGAEPASPPAGPFFVDVAAGSGLDFVHENGAAGSFHYPELMQGGAAFLDYDGDGWLDVYLVQSGPFGGGTTANANHLYRNRRDGSFVDVTEAAGVGDRGFGSGVAVADFDGDRLVDMYVTNLGANTLYRNNGDGSFSDVTAQAGVGDPGYSTSAAFLDYDLDLDLDLYVCNYVVWSPRLEHPCLAPDGRRGYCSPLEYAPQPDTLYRNNGDGSFTDTSREAGIHAAAANGLGVLTADFDGDGQLDVYVANDQMANHLWLNNGDGSFREEALLLGSALNEAGQPEAGMGVAVVDWEEDGDWDLFLTHLSGETNTFYRNEGGSFVDATDRLRLGAVSQPYTGFGTGLVDFDQDGWLDLFIANGKVSPDDAGIDRYAEPNQLLRGLSEGRFADVSAAAGPGLALVEVSRSAVFGDYDNDGDVDILVANNDGPVRLLRNEAASAGHWLGVELDGQGRDGGAIGATVTLEAGGRVQNRLLQPAQGYCASHDPRLHFGLGELERIDRLRVRWPDGTRTERHDVAADRYLRIEGPARGGREADAAKARS